MSDQETIDVTSTNNLHNNADFLNIPTPVSEKCAYCDCDKDGLTMFYCTICNRWIHSSCLHQGSPSTLLSDNYFYFQCTSCSAKKKETFERVRLTWNAAVSLALYNLAHSVQGKEGFFRWKEDICAYIDQHWEVLFEDSRKKTSTWMNTVASTLSAGNPTQFMSGYGCIGESGYWKLTNPTIPPEYKPEPKKPQIETPTPVKKTKSRRSRNALLIAPGNIVEGLRKRNYQSSALNAAHIKEKRSRTQNLKSPPKPVITPKAAIKSTHSSPASEESTPSFQGCMSPVSSPLSSPRSNSATSMLSKSDLMPDNCLPLAILSDDSDSEESINRCEDDKDSENRETPPPLIWSAPASPRNRSRHSSIDATVTLKRSRTPIGTSLPEADRDVPESFKSNDADDSKDVKPGKSIAVIIEKKEEEEENRENRLQKMSLYEEEQLLRKLISFGKVVDDDPTARRLRRKLLLRSKKRSLGLPLFDLQSTARRLIAKERGITLPEPEDSMQQSVHNDYLMQTAPVRTGPYRILDRFQAQGDLSLTSSLNPTKTSFLQKLVGLEPQVLQQPIVSPYTQRVLKPYIRRDFESKPTKLAVLQDIVYTYNKKHGCSSSTLSRISDPIDYCYIRPHHIANINAICAHFFWPGIDVTECLQYPDFTVVVLYKKMVIGFGIMVPDVGFKEAYISYLFVHPDWRKGGIASFMIYHLIQTCMGKDVTLHVSASNPAMILYQKFGFKPEEFINDFYDKYYSVDSTECKHAFFMRLRR